MMNQTRCRLFGSVAVGVVISSVVPALAQDVPPLPSAEGPIAEQVGNQQHPSRRGPTLGQATMSDWPEEGEPEYFGYVEDEFFVSGEANGAPYTTRIVFRHPADVEDFSGFVAIETLHPAQSAQMWMATRIGGMLNGHGYVEVVNAPGLIDSLKGFNAARYEDLGIEGAVTAEGQPDPAANPIIAQVAHLVKTANPLGEDWNADWLVMTGASYTSRTAMNFMEQADGNPAYRMEDGSSLIDAMYVWDTNGPTQDVLDSVYDVPVIILATQTEWMPSPNPDEPRSRDTAVDSDEAGQQYRLYQVAGMPHLEAREMQEAGTEACLQPLDHFMFNAMVYQGLEHMHEWLANDVPPPMAPRTEFEAAENDAAFVTDEFGNATGGVRSPQVEVPTHRFITPNPGEGFLCTLSGTVEPLSADQLRTLYKSPADHAQQLTEAANRLIEERWFPSEYLFEISDEIRRVRPLLDEALHEQPAP
ncbi:hypothetical protein FHG66_19635 [Rubellimicrobium rubrum]|uniref:Alpha/beta hydrolase domain-containing protein n=1 Tax=Rubellimicrobium rubrum TaxID=2585369 RepID=A0A5C4MK43_9RHOB|nr:alpha/beta hydrolase domain-containing protein [Rubellimicrobium rubrum]TNC46086.1 hypothetical protein FHG66_19635 [Rubellimicrobium rubrum]